MTYTNLEITKHRNEWVKALLSGVYRQSTSTLTSYNRTMDDYTHCCLGVAMCTAGLERGYAQVKETNDVIVYVLDDSLEEENRIEWATILPDDMMEYYGLDSESQNLLVTLNDDGCSFRVIATVIKSLPIARESVKIEYPEWERLYMMEVTE
jgi:hypothetical protein